MFRYVYGAGLILSSLFAIQVNAQTDTILAVRLKEVEVRDKKKWSNDTLHYYFNQMRYNVKMILPYVNAASHVFSEIEAKNKEGISKRERKRFISTKEDELRNNFEDRVRMLNETQGVLLIKLIARQTGVNIYSILGDFKNPVTAVKWQAWARLNGFNLNRKYDPADEPLLELVMVSLGYDLPGFYD